MKKMVHKLDENTFYGEKCADQPFFSILQSRVLLAMFTPSNKMFLLQNF